MIAAMADSRASKPLTLVFEDEAATVRFARKLAAALRKGDVVALSGGLGSGKTALARAVIRSFLPDEEVPSPTFTLVQSYDTPNFAIWHVDLYRLNSARDVRELGLDDALDASVLLIEWPERAASWLPPDRLEIRLSFAKTATARQAELIGHGTWAGRLAALEESA
jgi:tRNA threonylcarbamoyladenosine biosynthesis protein TsaE